MIGGVSAPLDLKQADFGTPGVSVAVAVALSFGLTLIAGSIPVCSRFGKNAVSQMAAGGFMVVLTHAAVLSILDTPQSGRLLDFAAAVVVPWTLALLLLQTPWAPFLLGVARWGHAARKDIPRLPDRR